jgi:hypothetical protein
VKESRIEQRTCELAWELLGVENTKLKDLGENGYPDRLFWLPGGKPLLIEFKRPGEKPEPKQVDIHRKLQALGYNVQVHTNEFDALEAIIEAVDTPQLPKEGREILTRARSCCAILRSRSRENRNHTSSFKDTN